MSLSFERLEDRVLLAVTVKQSGANLTITSDNDGDIIRVFGGEGLGEVQVAVDGQELPVDEFEGVQNIRIIGKGGDDEVYVDDQVQIAGSFTADLGAGEDYLDLEGAYGKNVSVKFGNDTDFDWFEAGDLSVQGNVSVNTGNGGSEVDFYATAAIGKNLTIKTGNGTDEIYAGYDITTYVSDVTVDGKVNINTGAGDDYVELGSLILVGGGATVNLGAGEDYLEALGIVVAGKVNANGGAGFDTLYTDIDPATPGVQVKAFESFIAET